MAYGPDYFEKYWKYCSVCKEPITNFRSILTDPCPDGQGRMARHISCPPKSWQEWYCEDYTAKLEEDAATRELMPHLVAAMKDVQQPAANFLSRSAGIITEWEVANREAAGVSFEPFEPSHQSFNNALERDDDTTEAYPI